VKRYLILPGKVFSKEDGQLHHVSAEELMRLYSVAPEECVVLRNEGVHGRVGLDNEFLDSLLWLAPRYDGDYHISQEVREQYPKQIERSRNEAE
jgi:hypothetical protein